MKKFAKVSAVLMSLLMLAGTFGACNGGKVSKTDSGSSSKTESSKTESSKADDISSQVESVDWKKLYTDRLNESDMLNDYRYSLIKLDGDDIPELFVDHLTQAEGGTLFYISGGELAYEELETNFAYAEGKGEFMTDYGSMGARNVCGYTLSDGNVVMYTEGTANENEQLPQPEYTWDGEDVTKEVFDKNVSDLAAGKSAATLEDKSEILIQIQNYK